MVSDNKTGRPVAWPFRLDGENAGAEQEIPALAPKAGAIEVAYDGENGLTTIAARDAATAGCQAILTVWQNNTLTGQWQSTADADGTALFAVTLLPKEATDYRFRVCLENTAALEHTQRLEPGASIVDKSVLQQVLLDAEAILENTEKMYTPDTMKIYGDSKQHRFHKRNGGSENRRRQTV